MSYSFRGNMIQINLPDNKGLTWARHEKVIKRAERSSKGSSRSHRENPDVLKNTPGDESLSRKSNKGTAGLEDLRLKRKNVGSNRIAERNDRKRSKIQEAIFQVSEHRDQKDKLLYCPTGAKKNSSIICSF
ncbi:hypothetical protein TNCV_4267131 [Trichonephila clavipes]|nr:hypothetical protein TNCV_4267131 [Trichonephila clavipes]